MTESAKKLEENPGRDFALYDDLLIPVCAVDEDLQVAYFNSSFSSFTKLAPRKLRQKSVREILSCAALQATDLIERCFKAWAPMVSEETTFAVGDGEIRDGIIKLIPHEATNGSRLVVISIQDISIERLLHAKHRIQLDELKAKNAEIKKYSEGLEILVEERTQELRAAMGQSERLLLNILPRKIADRLKTSDGTIADRFNAVSVLFVDIVSFTPITSSMDPIDVVDFLSQLFDSFDSILDAHNVEKIKTIGDCYLAVAGVPVEDPRHASNLCRVAIAMLEELKRINAGLMFELDARFGIHSGPVVAGVIGHRKFAYDIWGDTVNVASRMESHGMKGRIQISEATYELVKDEFACEERGIIDVKGKGQVRSYWLLNQK